MRLVLILLLCCIASCEEPPPQKIPVPVSEDSTFLTGTFYLVRHAEQLPGIDSSLTDSGYVRAGALYHLLKDSGIQKIYITPYLRSAQTADSIREALFLDTVSYKPDSTGEGLLYEITRHGDWGKKLLVVGHNYSLYPILKALKVKVAKKDSIRELDYSDLFIVRKYRDSVKSKHIIYSSTPFSKAKATEK